MRVVVVGAGACGARAGRQLLSPEPPDELVLVAADRSRADAVAASLGPPARVASAVPPLEAGDVVLLAAPGSHRVAAQSALDQGAHVVSLSDSVPEVRSLLELDAPAASRGLHVVVGAGFSPGLSCVLAALAARGFERVEEVHVAKVGTGGPACARQHHRALGGRALDWRGGGWERRSSGSGRELCWFPDPVRAVDCYRAELPEPLLLVPAFAGVERVTARLAANRRDRLTSRLPMLRRPHPEGELGAIRVEVRGVQGPARDDRVLGAVDRPAVAAGAVAALACRWAAEGRLARPGAAGLAVLVEPGPFLATLADRGVKVAVFEGGQHGSAHVPQA
ncbi:MAG TPA: hypothetical protein VHH09_07025 [Acidimicrobiales bacterium]|nr:hypothetical protein [Acidimicrobiales bacterium]